MGRHTRKFNHQSNNLDGGGGIIDGICSGVSGISNAIFGETDTLELYLKNGQYDVFLRELSISENNKSINRDTSPALSPQRAHKLHMVLIQSWKHDMGATKKNQFVKIGEMLHSYYRNYKKKYPTSGDIIIESETAELTDTFNDKYLQNQGMGSNSAVLTENSTERFLNSIVKDLDHEGGYSDNGPSTEELIEQTKNNISGNEGQKYSNKELISLIRDKLDNFVGKSDQNQGLYGGGYSNDDSCGQSYSTLSRGGGPSNIPVFSEQYSSVDPGFHVPLGSYDAPSTGFQSGGSYSVLSETSYDAQYGGYDVRNFSETSYDVPYNNSFQSGGYDMSETSFDSINYNMNNLSATSFDGQRGGYNDAGSVNTEELINNIRSELRKTNQSGGSADVGLNNMDTEQLIENIKMKLESTGNSQNGGSYSDANTENLLQDIRSELNRSVQSHQSQPSQSGGYDSINSDINTEVLLHKMKNYLAGGGDDNNQYSCGHSDGNCSSAYSGSQYGGRGQASNKIYGERSLANSTGPDLASAVNEQTDQVYQQVLTKIDDIIASEMKKKKSALKDAIENAGGNDKYMSRRYKTALRKIVKEKHPELKSELDVAIALKEMLSASELANVDISHWVQELQGYVEKLKSREQGSTSSSTKTKKSAKKSTKKDKKAKPAEDTDSESSFHLVLSSDISSSEL